MRISFVDYEYLLVGGICGASFGTSLLVSVTVSMEVSVGISEDIVESLEVSVWICAEVSRGSLWGLPLTDLTALHRAEPPVVTGFDLCCFRLVYQRGPLYYSSFQETQGLVQQRNLQSIPQLTS